MTMQIAAMIVGLLLVSAAALWGLNGLNQDYDVALESYRELRAVYGEVGSGLATARELLRATPGERGRAAEQVGLAEHKFDLFLNSARLGPNGATGSESAETALRGALRAAATQLNTSPEGQKPEDLQRADMKAVTDALGQIRAFYTQIHTRITERQIAARKKWSNTIVSVGVLCGFVVAGAVLLGVLQYRSVVLPLRRLGSGVRNIAAGQFQQRLHERGSQEFNALADDFNRMAGELDEFYHRLEQKVADKSRELIRSERLASVGYLAAGVAHEINNPLGIIAGYAEYSIEELKRRPQCEGDEDLNKSLQVICDESFRCKDIIGKLLSLARPGEGSRGNVDLAKIAAEVSSAVGGLRDYRDRKIIASPGQVLLVNADESEMKQIVLNLTVNALEAVPPGGEVNIAVSRNNGWIELRVCDNGRGMNAQTLERVFEPFFTDKRGSRQPGTGLGLSITHAIVESHGGRIRAASAGIGKGSEFVVQLPAVS
jgi:two-component system, NtrC family, sensor kinase